MPGAELLFRAEGRADGQAGEQAKGRTGEWADGRTMGGRTGGRADERNLPLDLDGPRGDPGAPPGLQNMTSNISKHTRSDFSSDSGSQNITTHLSDQAF